MTPAQYRSMLNRAIEDGDEARLDTICLVLAESEIAKSVLQHLDCGPASDGIDKMLKRLLDRG